jgi:hypothetical protein
MRLNEFELIDKASELTRELIESNFKTIDQARKESDKKEGKFTLTFTLKPFEAGHELDVKFSCGITYKDSTSCEIDDLDQEKLNLEE